MNETKLRERRSSITANPIEDVALELPTITLPSIGTGLMRTTATYIALLLQLEDDCRLETLVSAAKHAGLSIEDIVSVWHDKSCPLCGCSLRSHDRGECP